MSISSISANNSLSQSLQAWQAKAQKIQTEFQQLGQDLQAGNLTHAQSDFTALSQNFFGPAQANASQPGNPGAAQNPYAALQANAGLKTPDPQSHHLGKVANFAANTLSQAFQGYMLGLNGAALPVVEGLSSLA